MNNIQKYFAGREQFIELLEAVGIRTLEQFASADPSTVLPELHQAKRMLKLQTEIPSASRFQGMGESGSFFSYCAGTGASSHP